MLDFRLLVYLIEPILMYLAARRDARRYHKYRDPQLLDSKYDKIPCGVIRRHFGLKKEYLRLNTHFHYIFAFVLFIRIFAVLLLGILTGFSLYFAEISILIHVIGIAVYGLISIILEYRFIYKRPKKQREKTILEEFRDDIAFIGLLKDHKARSWELSLKKDLKKCLKKRKGKEFLPSDSIRYVETKILSKYQKYMYHEICTREKNTLFLEIYSKKDDRLIQQLAIQKI